MLTIVIVGAWCGKLAWAAAAQPQPLCGSLCIILSC
jgi:hypothetical protein